MTQEKKNFQWSVEKTLFRFDLLEFSPRIKFKATFSFWEVVCVSSDSDQNWF